MIGWGVEICSVIVCVVDREVIVDLLICVEGVGVGSEVGNQLKYRIP